VEWLKTGADLVFRSVVAVTVVGIVIVIVIVVVVVCFVPTVALGVRGRAVLA